MASDYDYLFKVIILGDSGVGKTAVLNRFTDGDFRETDVSTIGVDFKIKIIDVEGKRIKLQAWDTAGQERFRSLVASYYKGTHGTILTYDVNNQDSFVNIQNWARDIEMHNLKGIEKLLLGNKVDLNKREVSADEVGMLCTEHRMSHFEVSAKTGEHIDQAFTALAKQMLDSMRQSQRRSQVIRRVESEKLSEKNPNQKNSRCSC